VKLVDDTLKINGKWAHKRVMAFVSFHAGILYAFTPVFCHTFEVKEFVIIAFFGLSAGCLGIDLQQQIKVNSDNNTTNTTVVNNETIG
jgi:hypothetical protein